VTSGGSDAPERNGDGATTPMTTVPGPGGTEPTTQVIPRRPGQGVLRGIARLPGWFVLRVRAIVVRCVHHDATATASQFAYNAFLATVPFLFFVISLIGLLPGSLNYDSLLNDYGGGLPDDLERFVRTSLHSATESTGRTAFFLVLGLVGAVYLAANVMGTTIGALDRARGAAHRPFLRGKVVHLTYSLATGLLIALATIALVGGPRLIDELARRLTGSDSAPGIAQQMVFAGGIVIFFLVTIALYVFGPNARRRPLMTEVPGALLAVAGWIVVTRIFAEYVDRFESFDAVYGSLGFVVVYLVFLWLTGLLVVIGAEINEELYDERRRRRAFR
jgi:membrane protein